MAEFVLSDFFIVLPARSVHYFPKGGTLSTRQFKYCLILVIVFVTNACPGRFRPPQPPVTREISADGVWERVADQKIVFESSVVKVKPRASAVFRLKQSTLNDILKQAPPGPVNHAPVVLTLPRPDGSYSRYQIEESPVMEPALAKQFPMIKTYRGRGLDDRTATARFEQTPRGLHAMILSASGAFLVDAVGNKSDQLYVSYFKKDLPPNPDEFACVGVHQQISAKDIESQSSAATSPGILRIYRIAVTASHRYVAAIHSLNDPAGPTNDPLEEALEAITRTINRVNLIYERDLGIHLNLINDEPRIIHTDAGTNPYNDDSNDDDQLRAINTTELTQTIGIGNYDVGQLFLAPTLKGRGGSGQPCACSPFFKALGLVGSPHPTGNAFDVQYVAHEIAHQFGASHSFNGTLAGCHDNRNPATAYEPGSGSTIMGYSSATNICGAETIQSTPDPYFHAISLKEIRKFITTTGSKGGDICAEKRTIGNNFVPQVNAGPDYTVPGRTPFALTVQSSSDGDGDPLTFTWEEFYLGPPDPPHPELPADHLKKRPLFRSWEGSSNLTRLFPAIDFIMNPPSIYVAESMPANNRPMKFRVTARDGRGLFGFDEVSVTVVSKRGPADVGPFAVTEPGTGVVWPRGSTQTIRWAAARTDRAPINCTQVRILFIIRSAPNNPIVLANAVSNVSQTTQVTLPADLPLTTMGRIKVEAVGNIFFNISSADIQIVAASGGH